MFRRSMAVVLLVVMLTVAAGCGAAGVGSSTSSSTAVSSTEVASQYSHELLADALGAAGLSVSWAEETQGEAFFEGSTLTAIRASDGSVQVYTFATPEEAAAAASQVSADGSTLPTAGGGAAMVEWVGRPHLFLRDRIIVIYISARFDSRAARAITDELILRTLQSEMGPQFAGG